MIGKIATGLYLNISDSLFILYIVFIVILYMSSSISSTLNELTLNKLNKLYLRSGYMDKYGMDVWITTILCISFIL